jgi:16S rRNA (guanine966-N2)-methyltransferase
MRIVAGSRKGAKIFAPKGIDTRPTGDRVREAVFNLVGPVDGASVLDLYAGSGAMGLEALSRGAESAVFVESDRDACRAIKRNLDKLALAGAEIACRDALAYLASRPSRPKGGRFDLILVDPPYDVVESVAVRLALYLPGILAENGLVVLESSSRAEPELPPLDLRTSRRYGSARVSLFEAAA